MECKSCKSADCTVLAAVTRKTRIVCDRFLSEFSLPVSFPDIAATYEAADRFFVLKYVLKWSDEKILPVLQNAAVMPDVDGGPNSQHYFFFSGEGLIDDLTTGNFQPIIARLRDNQYWLLHTLEQIIRLRYRNRLSLKSAVQMKDFIAECYQYIPQMYATSLPGINNIYHEVKIVFYTEEAIRLALDAALASYM